MKSYLALLVLSLCTYVSLAQQLDAKIVRGIYSVDGAIDEEITSVINGLQQLELRAENNHVFTIQQMRIRQVIDVINTVTYFVRALVVEKVDGEKLNEQFRECEIIHNVETGETLITLSDRHLWRRVQSI